MSTLANVNWKLARVIALLAAGGLGAAGVVLTMNLMKPLNERFGPALLRDIDLLLMGPSLVFAGIILTMLATAPDRDRLQERLFVIVILVAAAAAFMFVTGQWVMSIFIFIGGPTVVLVAVLLVYAVLRLVARWEIRK